LTTGFYNLENSLKNHPGGKMYLRTILVLIFLVIFFTSCSKEPDSPDPPYIKSELIITGTFDTWAGGIIMSPDPAGITFHQPSGHLLITDPEIDELNDWDCKNVFEVSLAGDSLFNTFDIYHFGGDTCPANNKREPTGITYSPVDGFFYVTNDNNRVIQRYNGDLETPPLAAVDILADDSTAIDPEGITCDPNGNLYVVCGRDGDEAVQQIMVYNSNLEFITKYIVADKIFDPEGIAYYPVNKHLFIVSQRGNKLYEYTIEGAFVDEYDISNFSPPPVRPRGLTFAPSSDPTDDPDNFNLYIVDAQLDNKTDPNERDGMVYEVKILNPQP
jgi:sugar lactone lactonase YvrE